MRDDVIQGAEKVSVNASDEDTTTDITDNQELSVDVETASSHTGIPTLLLRQMWAKAIELLNSNQVLPAPGCTTSSRMVASTSKKKPHFVSVKDGRFECDDECPNFLQRYICSHCIAAAENNGLLEEFVKSYGVYAKTPKGKKALHRIIRGFL